ncbi:CDP-alcohol phosphatidyltransferase family protein [Stieleria varia]|uniref:CDP-alcohol phosphatidyltransferase n=1 Tax=Stieleria varia TaxID=2528005 RepID=A0A5C6AXT2_9BACT|nr:CDP-alcohol phosphatidyltransferase family protein [Stieleria varia]TWU04723.1 CDP-alcohol phosphatidyltransferase [Stieleria varia]
MTRISHSLLDPLIGPRIKALYPHLRLPRSLPPEAIVLAGHLSAIAGAVGFAFSTRFWWGGVLAAIGVAGNHAADCLDGTHARQTGQCRNGGELLDHFTDPLSFAYWMIGIAVACGRLDIGLAAVCCLFAFAVLTNIKAKMTGEFQLAAFGPTEFKTGLVLLGIVFSSMVGFSVTPDLRVQIATWVYAAMTLSGCCFLVWQLVSSIREVNQSAAPADTSEWVCR